jgi:hypothetical protein
MKKFVVFVLILALLLAGGAGGYWWWKDQPKQLIASADLYVKQGEEALVSENSAAAKQAFLKADEKLARVLALNKDPKNSQAALRRFEVQANLIKLYGKEDSPEAQVLREKARAEARKCAEIAAADKKNVQAQVLLLNLAFRNDEFQDALTYAENLLDVNADQDDALLTKYPIELAAAHYLKGLAALQADPPRPEETLTHVKACQEIEKQASSRDEKQRWREIDLEARALQVKAKDAKTRGSGVKKGVTDDSMAVLLKKIPDWIQRAQEEKGKVVVPKSGEQPDRAMIVLLHPSNMRGLFKFLNLSIELAQTPEEAVDRANLILDYCQLLIAGRFLSPKALEYVNGQLALLTTMLNADKTDKSDKLRKASPDTRDHLKQRIEELTKKNQQAGAVMDPALYAQLAQGACNECRWEAAESFALEGLSVAAARKLPSTDPVVTELHESAAYVLLLKKNLMTRTSIS